MWWRWRLLSYYHYSGYAIKEWCQCKNTHKKSNLKPPPTLSNSRAGYNPTAAACGHQCYRCASPLLLRLVYPCLQPLKAGKGMKPITSHQKQFPSLQQRASEDIVQLRKTLCSSATSGDEQLKRRFMVNWESYIPWERKHTPKSLAGHLGEEDNFIPFAHKGINLLGIGNQLIQEKEYRE